MTMVVWLHSMEIQWNHIRVADSATSEQNRLQIKYRQMHLSWKHGLSHHTVRICTCGPVKSFVIRKTHVHPHDEDHKYSCQKSASHCATGRSHVGSVRSGDNRHAALWATVNKYNISANLIQVSKHLNDKATSAVLFNGSIGDWFQTTIGVR